MGHSRSWRVISLWRRSEGGHRIPANMPITVSEYLRLLHNLAAMLEMLKLG